jgi:flagellar basal-body rod modification protein FlgD
MFVSIPTASTVGVAATAAQNGLPTQTLGQDDFLRLLITQMTTQDPLSPKSDTDFIAQMAQFSSLEQSRSMQTDLAQLRADQQIVQANNLLGRMVEIQADPDHKVSGLVETVQVEAGTPKIVVDGQSYGLSQLLSITPIWS